MYKIIKKIVLGVSAFYCSSVLVPNVSCAYVISATEVYRQAKLKNYSFMQELREFPHVIDVQNSHGDTAYCIAMKYNDASTQQMLLSYGADSTHPCVQRYLDTRQQNYVRQSSSDDYVSKSNVSNRQSVQKRYVTKAGGTSVSTGNHYLWWGLGTLAVGGGVAAAASGGGGGNSSHSISVRYDSGTASSRLDFSSAAGFETGEYEKGNFLDAINASKIYSILYTKDENGNLIGHQAANYDEPLKKVVVGVIDTGVYEHQELAGKIVGQYDANKYNDATLTSNASKVFALSKGDIHYYIISKGGKYYYLRVNGNTSPVSIQFPYYGGIDFEQLNSQLASQGMDFSQFRLINSGGGANPGASDAKFNENDVKTWWSMLDNLSHGTHIASIIAGSKNDNGMHGVAFENAQIYAGSWDYSQDIYDMVTNMVNSGVGVLNNSWGFSNSSVGASSTEWLQKNDSRSVVDSYLYAANHQNKPVWVQATGNEGRIEAGAQTALGKFTTNAGKYEVPFLAVTALDINNASEDAPSGQIAGYANWCGTASDYCLAAPGNNIYGTAAVDGAYVNMSGTSMAAPVVSGSIALLMGYYPYLSGQNIAWLLLKTANKEGVYADSAIYGQGALDLERAITMPIGSLAMASNELFGSLTTISSNRLAMTGTMQKKLQENLPKTVTAFDELNRPFEVETKKLFSTTHGSNAHLRNEVAHAAMAGQKKTIKDEKSGFQFTTSEALNKGGKENLSTAEIIHETEEGSSRFYYAENSRYMTAENVVSANNNPFFAMNDAYGAENTLKLSDSSKLKLSLQTGENGMYERDYEQDRHSFDERSYAFGAEYSFNLTDYLEMSTLGGMLYEENAMLGMNGQGGFAIKDGSTYYMGLKTALNLTPNITLLAAYYRGYTRGQDATMLSISDLQTESFMIAGEYKLNGRDKVGLSLSSPLTVAKGRSTFRYASGRDNYSDTIYMKKLTSSLKPAAKEYDLGLYYLGQPSEDLNLTGKVEARFNADGEKGTTDYLGIMGMQYNF